MLNLNNKIDRKTVKLFIIIVAVVSFVSHSQAANNGNSSDYIWTEKVGYISMSGENSAADYGVTVADASLSGYGWSEATGWVNFNDAGAVYAVTNDGFGNLSGWAWSEKLGYISFDDASANNYYQVAIDANSNFSGYAWSEKIGYINMNDAGALYQAATTWESSGISIMTDSVSSITTSGATANGTITTSGTVTQRGFKYALVATSTCDSWTTSESGSYSGGSYSLPITSLTRGTTYYTRAFAVSPLGIIYGACEPFTTAAQTSPVIIKGPMIIKENVILK